LIGLNNNPLAVVIIGCIQALVETIGLFSRPLKSNMIQCSQYFILIKAIKNLQENATIELEDTLDMNSCSHLYKFALQHFYNFFNYACGKENNMLFIITQTP
jgi:hypothetical protein